ncbi:Transposase domain containing protein [Ceratobasidium theobromae]|uniref:Transposase domain containing protein n=1 Tax=Ceratobasidium theobromae TaxID=1582974 RepID=A0A5N5Q7V5_9AGAM|nr:Transposase domain containing protein [Ceratobasidium theobromae]
MERFCSFIGASVKSRRFPYANIIRRIRDVTQLRMIRDIYHLQDQISFKLQDDTANEVEGKDVEKLPDYPCALLLTPKTHLLEVTPPMRRKITKFLATAFEVDGRHAQTLIPSSLKQWGRLQISNGGDLIQAHGYHQLRSDGRDSSFVRYELLVDINASRRNAPVVLKRVSHYGQLERLFALPLEPRTILNNSGTPRTLLLALIYEAPFKVEHTHQFTVVSYEGELGSGEVVDAQTIQCVVGRIKDGKKYWIVDRSAECELSFPVFE